MNDDPRQTGEMPFFEHLAELRTVLIHVVAASLAGAIAGWWLAPYVLEDLIHRTVKQALLLTPLALAGWATPLTAGLVGIAITAALAALSVVLAHRLGGLAWLALLFWEARDGTRAA